MSLLIEAITRLLPYGQEQRPVGVVDYLVGQRGRCHVTIPSGLYLPNPA